MDIKPLISVTSVNFHVYCQLFCVPKNGDFPGHKRQWDRGSFPLFRKVMIQIDAIGIVIEGKANLESVQAALVAVLTAV
jgi:hypothetical protein